MRKDFVVTMTMADKERLQHIASTVRDILISEVANNEPDSDRRAVIWNLIRDFIDVQDVFE